MAAIHQISREILHRVNGEIFEAANLLSTAMLTGLFRALFRVERATEVSEVDIFAASDDPALLMERRMSAAHWRHFPLYLANEDLLVKRFNVFTEYDFIFVADLTPSMGYRWRDAYLGQTGLSENPDFLPAALESEAHHYSSTKLYLLKYLTFAFLLSAVRFGFRTRALFFTGDETTTLAGINEEIAFHALQHVDLHFLDPAPDIWEASRPAASPYEAVLQSLLETRHESVVVFLSDFLDLAHGRGDVDQLLPMFTELKYRHRLAVLQVNDPREVNTRDNRDDHPSSTRWAFQRDVETPDEGGIGKQRYYRAPGRNREFVQRCRRLLGTDDRLDGELARRLNEAGIIVQKFVHGQAPGTGNQIEERIEEMGHWLEGG